MSKSDDTLNKAYGSIPNEVAPSSDLFYWVPSWRGAKYYWYRLIRKVTR